jgi:hypothetical protein
MSANTITELIRLKPKLIQLNIIKYINIIYTLVVFKTFFPLVKLFLKIYFTFTNWTTNKRIGRMIIDTKFGLSSELKDFKHFINLMSVYANTLAVEGINRAHTKDKEINEKTLEAYHKKREAYLDTSTIVPITSGISYIPRKPKKKYGHRDTGTKWPISEGLKNVGISSTRTAK